MTNLITVNICKSMARRERVADDMTLRSRSRKNASMMALVEKMLTLQQKNEQELAKTNPDMALVARRNKIINEIYGTVSKEMPIEKILGKEITVKSK